MIESAAFSILDRLLHIIIETLIFIPEYFYYQK